MRKNKPHFNLGVTAQGRSFAAARLRILRRVRRGVDGFFYFYLMSCNEVTGQRKKIALPLETADHADAVARACHIARIISRLGYSICGDFARDAGTMHLPHSRKKRPDTAPPDDSRLPL